MTRGLRTCTWIVVGGLLAELLPGQGDEVLGDPRARAIQKKADDKRANRLIRAMELPDKRTAAVRDLLKMGRAAVPMLVRNLRDPRPEVLCRLVLVLRILGDAGRPAILVLREIAEGEDAKLAYAARLGLSTYLPQGITLVADYNQQRIVEIDEKGKENFQIPRLIGVFDAERLPNGNYLVALAGRKLVEEIDRKGDVVWKYTRPRLNPLAATRLPNDHTLIADAGDKEILEVDVHGKVVWKVATRGAYSAQRLPSGNTLISEFSGSGVYEVDHVGKKVWEYGKARMLFEARRLDNGNTILSEYSQKLVLEVDRAGKEVLRIKIGKSVDTACRIPGGATIVGGTGFVRKYDAKGKLIWDRKCGRAGTVHYY